MRNLREMAAGASAAMLAFVLMALGFAAAASAHTREKSWLTGVYEAIHGFFKAAIRPPASR